MGRRNERTRKKSRSCQSTANAELSVCRGARAGTDYREVRYRVCIAKCQRKASFARVAAAVFSERGQRAIAVPTLLWFSVDRESSLGYPRGRALRGGRPRPPHCKHTSPLLHRLTLPVPAAAVRGSRSVCCSNTNRLSGFFVAAAGKLRSSSRELRSSFADYIFQICTMGRH